MYLLIVESPAKAKTINKYLGKDYKVLASFGHIRDLPSKKDAVLPDQDFKLTYLVDSKSKKHFDLIAKEVKSAKKLILATDPDREGETISWHLFDELKNRKKLPKDIIVERVVFNEITKKAILNAIKNPREIDQNLVDAGTTRRVLDYLVGFTLSPILWRKLPGSKSAGRVQSVALKLICQRELDIEEFNSQEYWDIKAIFNNDKKENINANLVAVKGEKLEKLSIKNEKEATKLEQEIKKLDYAVNSIKSRLVKRKPYPPFITSTLQQDASNKLGFTAKRTMSVAQRLYEGIELEGQTTGLITYMRTDGVTISQEAISSIRDWVKDKYGDKYIPAKPNFYVSKVKNAQEAHEAIRPTHINLAPDDIKQSLSEEQYKLYKLIWQRTVASQMSEQETEQTSVEIISSDQNYLFKAVGTVLKFKGWTEIYGSTKKEDNLLPNLTEQKALDLHNLEAKQHFTEPPPRYNEASLVKKMEELGIGRPSTYANIISIIQEREYVRLEQKRFFPEERGMIVTSFLMSFFEKYFEYDFTAKLEEGLDHIASGEVEWKKFMQDFWQGFDKVSKKILDVEIPTIIEAITKKLEFHYFKNEKGEIDRSCSSCKKGKLQVKFGKFGAFIACDNYPDCEFTRQTDSTETSNDEAITEDKVLGKLANGEEVILKKGPYGFYLETKENDKVKRSSVPKFVSIEELDWELAQKIIALPKNIGNHPENNQPIIVNNGKFGPYLKNEAKSASISSDELFTITLEKAVELLSASKKSTKFSGDVLGKDKDGNEIKKMKGRYGPYLKIGKKNLALPKGVEYDEVTLEKALEIIENKK